VGFDGMRKEARSSFFEKKEPKKLLFSGGCGESMPQPAVPGVFLVLFLQKKNFLLPCSHP
jgi:hypothetical protein